MSLRFIEWRTFNRRESCWVVHMESGVRFTVEYSPLAGLLKVACPSGHDVLEVSGLNFNQLEEAVKENYKQKGS